MANEILSVAVFVLLPGHEETALATIRELSRTLTGRGYSRDMLYRGPDGEYVLVRYWKSDDARRAALDDAEAQRCWAKVAHEIRIVKVYESLDKVPL